MPITVRSFWGGLTQKLILGFGSVLVTLLLIAIILGIFLTSRSRVMEQVQRENYNSVRYCDNMKNALDEIQAIAQSYPQKNTDILNAIEKAQKDFLVNASAQVNNSYIEGEQDITLAAAESGKKLFQFSRRLFEDSTIADPAGYYHDEIFPEYQRCRNLVSEVSQMNLANFVRVNAQVQSALLAMRTTIVILLATGILFSGTFIIVMARGMVRPLMQLRDSVHQIETGNLDLLIQSNGHDEIGQLALAFNSMTAKLRNFRELEKQRLIRTEQTTQVAIDSLPDAVAVLDVQGRIEISNRSAQVHFQLTPGSNIHTIRPDWAKMFLEPVLTSKSSVVPDGYRSAIQIFDENGEHFLLPRSVPMFDASENLIGVTLILVEITHLRKADEFKSGLLSAVSHELKTPLTSIRMVMRMLLDARIGPLNEQQHTLLDAAKIDSERLVRTVEDILTIGRVEAGRTRVEKVDVLSADILNRAITSVESTAGERAIKIIRKIDDSTLRVHVDMNLMSCALANLLSNAIKYSPAGSTVKVSIIKQDGTIEFAIEDQGPGIPEEYKKMIFEKFVRIPTADGPSGVGLGLAIASEIAQLHGGAIRLAATSKNGSIFILQLPVSDSHVNP